MGQKISIEFLSSKDAVNSAYLDKLNDARDNGELEEVHLEALEDLERVIDSAIKLLYKMEHSLLMDGEYPKQYYNELADLKKENEICKVKLKLPHPEIIDYPSDILSEYGELLKKAETLIEITEGKLKKTPNADLENRLEKLLDVRKFYRSVLCQ